MSISLKLTCLISSRKQFLRTKRIDTLHTFIFIHKKRIWKNRKNGCSLIRGNFERIFTYVLHISGLPPGAICVEAAVVGLVVAGWGCGAGIDGVGFGLCGTTGVGTCGVIGWHWHWHWNPGKPPGCPPGNPPGCPPGKPPGCPPGNMPGYGYCAPSPGQLENWHMANLHKKKLEECVVVSNRF